MTRGRINAGTSKKVLVSIVAGALYFGSPTPPVTPTTPPMGHAAAAYYKEDDFILKERRRRILIDNDDLYCIIKIWTEKCQT